jgi:quercetin dioxygenase-like cupin family protein
MNEKSGNDKSGHRDATPVHRPRTYAGSWSGVETLHYKHEGSAPFRDVSRQLLFGDEHLAAQLRYFEVQAGGYTTLERHQHMHAVLVLRGGGQALIGDALLDLAEHDLVTVPPLTWHQFRAPKDGPLGFLCMVNADRDRPQLPTAAERAALCALPQLANFLRETS